MRKILFLFLASLGILGCKQKVAEQWSIEKANEWYSNQDWLIGANFAPEYAINQLEMWQEDTFDPEIIERDLSYAQSIGMNTMRVFLHNLLWEEDSKGFLKRIDKYLEIADSKGIKTMFVLFDGVWHPVPESGKQKDPIPHKHTSGWVQSPGATYLSDTAKFSILEEYVKGIISRYAKDNRVIIWDIFNEANNSNGGSYKEFELKNKEDAALRLLKRAFTWARECNPIQPITSGVWGGQFMPENRKNREFNEYLLNNSDIITFHTYANQASMAKEIAEMAKQERPVICTEYMARPFCTFQDAMPLFRQYNMGCYNWGLVSGKTQTIYPWESWQKEYTAEPVPWFHDIFRPDGTPYDTAETNYIKNIRSLKAVPAPLYIDTNYYGSCDPEVFFNQTDSMYYIYYTSRRSKINDLFVATPIGVICSKNLVDWEFLGYCKFDGVGGTKDSDATFWAPALIQNNDKLHMFVTWKPDTDTKKGPWGGSASKIVHYIASATDPVNSWQKVEDMHTNDMHCLDATVYFNAGLFHVWFKGKKGETGKNELYHRVSADLKLWQDKGFSKSDVFNENVTGEGFEEAPFIFHWKNSLWLITDPHKGLLIYNSTDGENWKFKGKILDKGGNRPLDNSIARHCSAIVKDGRAFLFYHVEPWREYSGVPIFKQPLENRKAILQMSELTTDGENIFCNRDIPVLLRP